MQKRELFASFQNDWLVGVDPLLEIVGRFLFESVDIFTEDIMVEGLDFCKNSDNSALKV
jgi:hypothetical protein